MAGLLAGLSSLAPLIGAAAQATEAGVSIAASEEQKKISRRTLRLNKRVEEERLAREALLQNRRQKSIARRSAGRTSQLSPGRPTVLGSGGDPGSEVARKNQLLG